MLTDERLRLELNGETRLRPVDASDVLVQARRAAHRRRWLRRGSAAGLTTAATATVAVMLLPAASSAAILTVGRGSTPDVHNAPNGRVSMPGGMYVWREGNTIHLGYPRGARLEINVKNLGHVDAGTTLDPQGGQLIGGSTGQVAGIVPSAPASVSVTVDGVSYRASIACFEQLPGWCAYVASTGHQLPADDVHDPMHHIQVTLVPDTE